MFLWLCVSSIVEERTSRVIYGRRKFVKIFLIVNVSFVRTVSDVTRTAQLFADRHYSEPFEIRYEDDKEHAGANNQHGGRSRGRVEQGVPQ